MAQAVDIPDDMLRSGDLVDITLEIVGDNATAVALAVHDLKAKLAADRRFDYQGSEETEVYDPQTREPHRLLIITVLVRSQAKSPAEAAWDLEQERWVLIEPGAGQDAQVASLLNVSVLIAIVLSVLAMHAGSVIYKAWVLHSVTVNRSLSEAERIAALNALGKSGGISEAIAAAGGGLSTAAIGIGVLWVLSQMHQARGNA